MVKGEFFSALIAATLLAASSSIAQMSSSDTACTRHYVVKDGDTCDIIGQKTLTSTYQVMALNLPLAGKSCYTLEIGAQLCLGTYGNDCQMVHRAIDTDDCSTIAEQYNITQHLLRNNNPNLDCGQVYDGLMLCVLPGIVRPPADSSLNVSYIANSSYVAATMPLGTAIVATNAAEAGPTVVEIVTVQASATSSTTSSTHSSSSSSTKSSSSSHSTATKRHVHLDSRSGHGHHNHNHQAAAKRYQMAHGEVTSDSL